MLVEFRSVVDAVRCAIELQSGMPDRNAGLPSQRRVAPFPHWSAPFRSASWTPVNCAEVSKDHSAPLTSSNPHN